MNTRWIRSQEVVSEEVNDGLLLVDPRSGAKWLLNAAAAMVWRCCEGTRVSQDVAEFCAALGGEGLLRVADGGGDGVAFSVSGSPVFRLLNSTRSATRRRPSPRGVSGPV